MIADEANSLADELNRREQTLAEAIVERHWESDSELAARYGQVGRQRCLEDAGFHLKYLAEAVRFGSPVLFMDYLTWARELLEWRGIPATDLEQNLKCLQETLRENFSREQLEQIAAVLDPVMPPTPTTAEGDDTAGEEGRLTELARAYLSEVLQGRRREAIQLISDAVAAGTSPRQVYLDVFQPVQHEIGRLWQSNEITVAEEHFCTAVSQLAMSQLYPAIMSGEKSGRVMVCACIGGEMHEIGARMVADLFEMEGWDTHFVGANTPVSGVVQLVVRRGADLLGLSATMTYHLAKVRETIEAVRRASSASIVVGGRPFNLDPQLWKRLGADACAGDARDVEKLSRQFLDVEQ